MASARLRGSTTRVTGAFFPKSCSSSASSHSKGRFLTSKQRLAPADGSSAVGSLRPAAASSRSTSTPAARSVALVSATACTSPSARRTAASSPSTSSRSRLVTPRCAAAPCATVSARMNSAPLAAATASSPRPAPLRRSSSRCALNVLVLGAALPAPPPASAAPLPSPSSSPPSPAAAAAAAPFLLLGSAGTMEMSRPWKIAPLSASAALGAHSGIMYSTYAKPRDCRVRRSRTRCTSVSSPCGEKSAVRSSSVVQYARLRTITRPDVAASSSALGSAAPPPVPSCAWSAPPSAPWPPPCMSAL
mmetsp:Transcript_1340/g.3924  ORF Transcript_1340/g.3924 Transcript_1340/m.3924 type:complete len:304 (-) Transcript_1340:540-1451(-)